MPKYDVALVVSIEADTYNEALKSAVDLADGIAQDGELICAITAYDSDNEGQRVLYLDPVEYCE